MGGRNQELGLACAAELSSPHLVVLVAGTDGTDGPMEDAPAGVCVDDKTVGCTRDALMSAKRALAAHDAYTFFVNHAPGCLIHTGATGTNVMDVVVVLYLPALAAREVNRQRTTT